jgi:hypothetical protein
MTVIVRDSEKSRSWPSKSFIQQSVRVKDQVSKDKGSM